MTSIRPFITFIHRQGLLLIPGACLLLTLHGCGGIGDAVAAPPPGPYKGPPHTLTISPQTVAIRAGASQELVATNSGGEAMRFFTDWKIVEGSAGGTLSTPVENGYNSTVTYTAPAIAGGPFHIVAADRANPTRYMAVSIVSVTP